jgi:acetoin utilization protein AcuC
MSERVAAIWGPAYAEAARIYDFGPQHPLRPGRVILAAELARINGLFDLPEVSVLEPRVASRAEIELVHHPDYIDAITRIGEGHWDPGDAGMWGVGPGDNPPFEGMHDAGALVAGSAVRAAEACWSEGFEHVWYPAGGLHHAMPARASGFCIYDDPAIAIAHLLEQGAERVAYLDVDVHHGDGVQEIFYRDPRVLTISLHESGRFLFPGTGFVDEIGSGDAAGTSVNLPLPPYTGDDAYLAAFDEVVPPLVEAFKPTVLFTQLGCDTHVTDPLAHLQLTTHAWRALATRIHQLAHSAAGGKWIATGGGGYSVAAVPRGWASYFAEMCGGRDLAAELSEEWRDIACEWGLDDPPTKLHDEVNEPDSYIREAAEEAKRSAKKTAERLFGYHGLKA